MAIDSPFMMSIISGIMITIKRLINRLTAVNSRLALSKRSSSNACMLNARMTIMPDRFSRATRFIRSISFWMILNLGRAIEMTITTRPISTITATAMIHHIDPPLPTARMTPPTPMMGA